jgi:hypothetical protein
MVLASLVLGSLLGQLAAATVRLTLEPEAVVVEASYRLARADSGATFVLLRLPSLSVELLSSSGEIAELAGLTRLRFSVDAAGDVTVRYRVRGERGRRPTRIPLPVPSVPAVGSERSVEVRIVDWKRSGLPGLEGAFPRVTAAGGDVSGDAADGSGAGGDDAGGGPGEDAVARLANVPSVVQLPGDGWPILRLLDWSVLALGALASVGWLWRSRRQASAG